MTKEKENKPVSASESKFYLHELREHSQKLFGVKPEVLDGVFFNTKEIQFTKTEVQKRIDVFLKKGVKQ
ncbi:hypothetical protein [Peribacillus loiseleuriae]|uniref:hypothetical protein n=1 Tax=Peribacillus loiseleuriae TaxID=1679170 RepID=UPI003D03A579